MWFHEGKCENCHSSGRLKKPSVSVMYTANKVHITDDWQNITSKNQQTKQFFKNYLIYDYYVLWLV